jgi:hypothetical protein
VGGGVGCRACAAERVRVEERVSDTNALATVVVSGFLQPNDRVLGSTPHGRQQRSHGLRL